MFEPQVTAQIVKSLMDKIVIPTLVKFASEIKKQLNIKVGDVRRHFQDYYLRMYDQLSIMNTLALKNRQHSLFKIYQPLTISVDNSKRESERIDNVPYQLIDKYHKILITDTAGMGKSTMSKFLFLKMIKDSLSIPIFIELRKISKNNTIIQEIIGMLNGIENKMDKDLLIQLMKKGNFYFILDGFDEIAESNRDIVIEDIKSFICNLSEGNNFILTSRPESMLSTFGDFKSFQILPLKENEAYSLLSKYDDEGEISSRLINELKSEKNITVKEFLKNPLLVTLLFVVYNHKATIPLKKHLFYSQVYDALFEDHDLSKGAQNIHIKYSGLDKDDFEKILRYIGFQSFRSNRVQYSRDQIMDLIEKANGFWTSLKIKPSEYIHDLITTVPIFVKDGLEYKWAHKSLSEYFAAKFIFQDSKDSQTKLLSNLYQSDNLPRYINLLDLYYDLDIVGFKQNILLPLLESYNAYLSNFDEDAMSYFLRNLCFLRKLNVKVTKFNTKDSGKFDRILEEEANTNELNITIYDTNSGKIISIRDFSSRNGNGKRMILLKLYEKRTHRIKCYKTNHSRFEWVGTLESDKWQDFESIIKQAEEQPDRLGELCDLVTAFDRIEKVYMEKEDLEKEIKLIRAELDAQSTEFSF